MKKTYVKPELYFENFELSTNIAAGCGKPTHTPTSNVCGVVIPGVGTVFSDKITGCEIPGTDEDHNICYHVPVDSEKLFTS